MTIKKLILSFIILFATTSIQAKDTPEDFLDYFYNNYSRYIEKEAYLDLTNEYPEDINNVCFGTIQWKAVMLKNILVKSENEVCQITVWVIVAYYGAGDMFYDEAISNKYCSRAILRFIYDHRAVYGLSQKEKVELLAHDNFGELE